ncbi:MAG: NUDIX domain-containing protein [Spirochaetales bacterium]|nr:NUDIX domain-containing protein [Spirochaetales bacterium]
MKILHEQNILPLDSVEDSLLKYMVIAARHKGRWVVVRLKGQETWCFPGGHREEGETMDEAAHRELFEETGAVNYNLHPLSVYGVDHGDHMSWGSIYTADINTFSPLPEEYEIEELAMVDEFPLDNARFPDIMPVLMDYLNKISI